MSDCSNIEDLQTYGANFVSYHLVEWIKTLFQASMVSSPYFKKSNIMVNILFFWFHLPVSICNWCEAVLIYPITLQSAWERHLHIRQSDEESFGNQCKKGAVSFTGHKRWCEVDKHPFIIVFNGIHSDHFLLFIYGHIGTTVVHLCFIACEWTILISITFMLYCTLATHSFIPTYQQWSSPSYMSCFDLAL